MSKVLISQIENLENKVKYGLEKIETLEALKNGVQNIQILKPPSNEPNPIKPKTILNLSLATVGGFFIMLFLSFLLEYILKNKERENSV